MVVGYHDFRKPPYLGLSPLPVTVTNEGLVRDPLLKIYSTNPGSDWHPGQGTTKYTSNCESWIEMFMRYSEQKIKRHTYAKTKKLLKNTNPFPNATLPEKPTANAPKKGSSPFATNFQGQAVSFREWEGIFCKKNKTSHQLHICLFSAPTGSYSSNFCLQGACFRNAGKHHLIWLSPQTGPPSRPGVLKNREGAQEIQQDLSEGAIPLVVPNIAMAGISPIFSIGNTSTQSRVHFPAIAMLDYQRCHLKSNYRWWWKRNPRRSNSHQLISRTP